MGRKRNPEKSKQLILDVSRTLFLEKGFDETSIQDIIDELGGLTKGVIYHYFDSKADILATILNENSDNVKKYEIEGQNGFEKIQNLLKSSFGNSEWQDFCYMARITSGSAEVLGNRFHYHFNYFEPIIKNLVIEGVQDGSINTDYPNEVAELSVLLINIWLSSEVNDRTELELCRRVSFIRLTLDTIGVPLISDEIENQMNYFFRMLKTEEVY